MEMDRPVESSQQMSLPLTLSHKANNINDITYIKPEPDDMEYTCQGVSNQHNPLPSPLKCEETMYCHFCPYSNVDFDRLKCHTFKQHPTGAAVVSFGESEHEIKFFCVKEKCNFSTTMCTVYEEHLMICCPIPVLLSLSGKVKQRLKSTLQFVLDFHNNHCLGDVIGLLEYFSSFNKIYTSEDDHEQLRKHLEHHNVLFSFVSRSSSLSEVPSSMVCEDIGERKLEGPLSSVPHAVPVFIVRNENTNLIESQTNIPENISIPVRKQNKDIEQLLKTDPSEIKISRCQAQTHLESQTVKNHFTCVICDNYFQHRSDFLTHMRIHSGEKRFKCDVCDKLFTYLSHLNVHKRIHTGEKPFKCDLCDQLFTRFRSLTDHKRIHSGEKPFKCDVCNAEFTNSSHLISHKRRHTGEKPFKCNVCDKCFAHLSTLTQHKRTHTGEKPFKCNICDKEFIKSGDLTVHRRIHTGEKPFKCHVCGKDFIASRSLSRHKRTHIPKKYFKCIV